MNAPEIGIIGIYTLGVVLGEVEWNGYKCIEWIRSLISNISLNQIHYVIIIQSIANLIVFIIL